MAKSATEILCTLGVAVKPGEYKSINIGFILVLLSFSSPCLSRRVRCNDVTSLVDPPRVTTQWKQKPESASRCQLCCLDFHIRSVLQTYGAVQIGDQSNQEPKIVQDRY